MLVIGLPILAANAGTTPRAAYWIVGGLFAALGLFVALRGAVDLSRIRSGAYPLLRAIDQGDRTYLAWIYQKQIHSKVEGVKVGESNNIVLVTRDNKAIEIVLNKKTSPQALIGYLCSEFPEALVGYSDAHQAAIKARFDQ